MSDPGVEKKIHEEKFQTGNVILISLTHLLHDIYTSFLAPLLPLLIERFNISLFLSGLLAVIQRVPSLFNPFVGILAERVKVRYFVIFAPAVTTLAMGLIGVAPAYTVAAVLLFVSGISSTMFHVPAPVLVKKISGDRVGMGMSYFMFGGELARTLGPLIIECHLQTDPFRDCGISSAMGKGKENPNPGGGKEQRPYY